MLWHDRKMGSFGASLVTKVSPRRLGDSHGSLKDHAFPGWSVNRFQPLESRERKLHCGRSFPAITTPL